MKSQVLHTVWCNFWRGCRGNLILITATDILMFSNFSKINMPIHSNFTHSPSLGLGLFPIEQADFIGYLPDRQSWGLNFHGLSTVDCTLGGSNIALDNWSAACLKCKPRFSLLWSPAIVSFFFFFFLTKSGHYLKCMQQNQLFSELTWSRAHS